jgi:hypothetical protein
LYNKFSKIIAVGDRAVAKVPIIHFADNTIKEGILNLDRKYNIITGYRDGGGLLGNNLLKKFNFILDNKEGFIYLKSNLFDKSNE